MSVNSSDFGTVLLDLSASNTTGIFLDNGGLTGIADNTGVAIWQDIYQGATLRAIQPTGSFRPLYRATGLGGIPSISFDGVNDGLHVFNFTMPTHFTIAVVGRFAEGAESFFIEQGPNALTNSGFWVYGQNLAPWTVNRSGNANYAAGVSRWAGQSTVATISYGISGGRYFKNGIQQANGTLNGTTKGSSVNFTGPLNIGKRTPGAGVITDGDFHRIIIYSGELSDINRQNLESALLTEYPNATKKFVSDGDSLTDGYLITDGLNYPYQLASRLGSDWVYNKFGVPNQTLAQMESDAITEIDPHLTGTIPANVLIVFGGINDFQTTGEAIVKSRFETYVKNRRAAGWEKIVGVTLLPHDDMGTTFTESIRQSFNSWMRNSYTTGLIDGVIDVEQDARIGASGAHLNDLYYNQDDIHLNSSGFLIFAQIAEPVLENFYTVASNGVVINYLGNRNSFLNRAAIPRTKFLG